MQELASRHELLAAQQKCVEAQQQSVEARQLAAHMKADCKRQLDELQGKLKIAKASARENSYAVPDAAMVRRIACNASRLLETSENEIRAHELQIKELQDLLDEKKQEFKQKVGRVEGESEREVQRMKAVYEMLNIKIRKECTDEVKRVKQQCEEKLASCKWEYEQQLKAATATVSPATGSPGLPAPATGCFSHTDDLTDTIKRVRVFVLQLRLCSSSSFKLASTPFVSLIGGILLWGTC